MKRRDNKEKRSRSSRSNSERSESIDDSIGHLVVSPGDSLQSGRYIVTREMGLGTFGKVLQCEDRKHNDVVAIKVIRKIERYIDSAKIEKDILNNVFDWQRKNRVSYFVKLFSTFQVDGHYFMVFEPLGRSLYDVIKGNDHVGLPLNLVREISRQLLSALNCLQAMELIHTDLKLENILFRYPEMNSIVSDKRGYEGRTISVPVCNQIKIIDFGGATYEYKHKSTIINTRQYRSPEVILELGWSYPSDIWSAGCILWEIYCGELLFATHDELEHLCLMENIIGPFPYRMIRQARDGYKYFDRDGWTRTNELSNSSYKYVRNSRPLVELFNLEPGDSASGIAELMSGLLCLDPYKRFPAAVASNCRFLMVDDK